MDKTVNFIVPLSINCNCVTEELKVKQLISSGLQMAANGWRQVQANPCVFVTLGLTAFFRDLFNNKPSWCGAGADS
jgi:hypothetical protein